MEKRSSEESEKRMALKQLILSRKLAEKRAALDELKAKRADQEQRRAAMKTRETELEAAVEEITAETEETVKAEVDKAVAEFEADTAALEAEIAETDQQLAEVQGEVDQLAAQLDELNRKLEDETQATEEPDEGETEAAEESRSRRGEKTMNRINRAAVATLVKRDDAKQFLTRVREFARQKRAVTGGELTIPQVMLPLIRERVEEASKLLRYVNLQDVPGDAQVTIMGTIPDAVWTAMCANLNELDFGFYGSVMGGNKLGGFVPVRNALLYDNDVALASAIIDGIGRGMGRTLDKSILYGTGNSMPLGIVTRLVQTEAPADYPASARPWEDLHTSNVKTISTSDSAGTTLFQAIINDYAAASDEYSDEGEFWAMNKKTRMKLLAEALNFNANGALVAGMENQMPVVGGDIVQLSFMPDNVIVAGYGMCYLLAQREGTRIDQSEHVRFIEDQTVFRGVMRADGEPSIPEAFVAIGINNTSVLGNAVSFMPDNANSHHADLAMINLGDKAITPAFNPDITTYTLSVTNGTSSLKLTSRAAENGAKITQLVGTTAVAQGSNASLSVGSNTIKFAVVNGNYTKTYTVTVTRAAS